MRVYLLLFLASASYAAANYVTLNNTSGSPVTQPYTISRVFTEGEFPSGSYPQPSISGSGVTPYQVDVKTHWSDGSICHALISFNTTVPGARSLNVNFVSASAPNSGGSGASGLTQAQMLTFNSSSWGAAINATNGTTKTANARTMLAAGAWSYWLQGPVVTQVLVEDPSFFNYDFGWKDKKYTALTSNVAVGATSISVNYSADICSLTLPTQVILDPTGYAETVSVSSCSGNTLNLSSGTAQSHYIGLIVSSLSQGDSWYDAPNSSFKSLHPMFILTFYAGWGGVKEDFILESPWTGSQQDQQYSLSLNNTSALTQVYSYPTSGMYTHIAASRWRQTFWDGAAPSAAVSVDFNLAYLAYSMALPNYDLTVSVPSNILSSDWNAFTATDEGAVPGGTANVDPRMGDPGGRAELGIYNAWSARWFYSMGTQEYQVMMGNANVSASIPSHIRESSTGLYFNSAHTVNAQGRVLSIDARPTVWPNDSRAAYFSNPADMYLPVGNVTMGSANWGMELSHWPELLYVPYLVTGDLYFLQELYYTGSFNLAEQCPGYANYCRGNDWGYPNGETEMRITAWGYRNVMNAWFFAPDTTPEKAYFRQKIDYGLAMEEGFQDVTNGSFAPTDPTCAGYNSNAPSSPWCWGFMAFLGGKSNPLHQLGYGTPGSYVGWLWDAGTSTYSPYPNGSTSSPFMDGYKWNVLGRMAELGITENAGMAKPQFDNLLHRLQDSSFNPYLVGAYVSPVQQSSTGTYFQTWAAALQAFNTADMLGTTVVNLQTYQGWDPNTADGIDNTDTIAPGYPWIIVGAASYLQNYGNQDGLSASAAYSWITNAALTAPPATSTPNIGYNPQYQILPRTTIAPSTPVTTVSGNGKTAGNFIIHEDQRR